MRLRDTLGGFSRRQSRRRRAARALSLSAGALRSSMDARRLFSPNEAFASASQIEYFTREAEPTGEAHDPVVWMDAESKRRGIKQNYEFVVRSIDPEKKVVQGLYNYKIPYDLLVMVPPHRPAQVLLDSGLADTETGIRVDYDTLANQMGQRLCDRRLRRYAGVESRRRGASGSRRAGA